MIRSALFTIPPQPALLIEIRLLGTVQVRDADGTDIGSLAASSKRLGVLAYLALHRPRGPQRRDALVAFFWPESDEQRARGSLRSLLSSLRRELGSDAILARGEEVGLSEDHVWCDAVAFEEAVASGELERALELYDGPLLQGFHPGGSSELDQWLERRRVELSRLAVEAAWALWEKAKADGDIRAAIRWARRGMELQPENEPGLRRLMELLDRVGDRTAALRAYEAFARRLEVEYEMEPTPETETLVEALRTAARSEAYEPEPAWDSTVASADPTPPSSPPASGASPTESLTPSRRQPPRVGRWRSGRLGGMLLAVVAVAAVGLTLRGHTVHGSTPLDASRIVVFPFRVSGASASLAYLREGMIDLLASDLTGRTGPRAVNPGLAVATWKKAERDGKGTARTAERMASLAATLGAGLVATGDVVGTPRRVILAVRLINARSRKVMTEARVSGPVDSLVVLTDRLAGVLLAGSAGEEGLPAASLADVPLPALRDYLQGLQAYRRGRFADATKLLSSALDRDSTFTRAALALIMAANWGVDPAPMERGERLALAGAGRLDAADRAMLHALAPPPQALLRLDAWERAVQANPDRAEAWYGLGDIMLHWGTLSGRVDARHRAAADLARSASLRPGFAPPYDHLIELAIDAGDLASARRRLSTFMSIDSTAPTLPYLRWRVALAEHDTSTLDHLRAGMDTLPTASLIRIVGMGDLDGVGRRDINAAASVLERRPGPPVDRGGWLQLLAAVALDEGRPARADSMLREYADVESAPDDALRTTVLNALYSDGDSTAARRAYGKLVRDLRTMSPSDPLDYQAVDMSRCVTAQWRVWHYDFANLAGAVRQLRASWVKPTANGESERAVNIQCAILVEAEAAVLRGAPDAAVKLQRADSVRDEGGFAGGAREYYANIALALLHERMGDTQGALEAVQRRPYHYWFTLGTFARALRMEGRLAAATGDRASAIQAYRHYLWLRAHPEPQLAGQVRDVRRRLVALESR